MSDGATSQPRAWLCKHCGERVDPTMEMCWSCGHDKQGNPQQDLSSDIEHELMVRPGIDGHLAKTLRYRGILFRFAICGWCVTGVFLMLAGPGPIHDRYHHARGPADYIVVVGLYLSLFLTFALFADFLIQGKDGTPVMQDQTSQALHRPWVRGWLTHGWGRFLFWFAWAWLLLQYL